MSDHHPPTDTPRTIPRGLATSPLPTQSLTEYSCLISVFSDITGSFCNFASMNQVPEEKSFAAIRMDPVATVRHLNDPAALRAAQAMSPRSYLIYLDCVCVLTTDIQLELTDVWRQHNPLPIWGSRPWHGFTIYPIGPSLRAANEDECVTLEMCTPLFPNDSHPDGRFPIHTEPPFPFDNCFLWSVADMDIRVCPRAEGFDRDKATCLPVGRLADHTRWIEYERKDQMRQRTAQQARQPHPHAEPSPAAAPCAQDDATSVSARHSAYSCSLIASTDSIDTTTELTRRFADPEKSPELHPLCHLWYDLAAHLEQDEIPSPVHLFEERDAIVR